MTKLEWPPQRTLIGGCHFVKHLGYRLSDKTHIQTWMRVPWKQSIYEIWKKSNMTKLERPRQQTLIGGGHFVGHLAQEGVESNSYMKFGRNLIKNDWVRVTTTADIDRWRPFCRPSWLWDVGQNPYSNLNERLVEAIHILWNMEDIRLKITEFEWPRTDRRTDKPKTIELRQHSLAGP